MVTSVVRLSSFVPSQFSHDFDVYFAPFFGTRIIRSNSLGFKSDHPLKICIIFLASYQSINQSINQSISQYINRDEAHYDM